MNAYNTYAEAKKEITVENFNYSNVKKWIENYSHKQKVEFAIYSAELVVPKKAIQAAKDWLLNPSEENKQKCKYAAANAYAAASASEHIASLAAYSAAYTADAAAYTAGAATYAANAATYAANAAYAAAYAAYAAYSAADTVKEKIINHILSKYEQTETPEEKEAFEVMVKDNEAVDLCSAPSGATHYGIHGCDELLFFKCDNDIYLMWKGEDWSLSSYAHHEWLKKLPALDQPKPNRTKFEYVKVEFKHAWQAVKFIEEGGSFWVKKTEGLKPFWMEIKHLQGAVADWEFAHDKVETELTEREAFIEKAFDILCRGELTAAKQVFAVIYDELVEGE